MTMTTMKLDSLKLRWILPVMVGLLRSQLVRAEISDRYYAVAGIPKGKRTLATLINERYTVTYRSNGHKMAKHGVLTSSRRNDEIREVKINDEWVKEECLLGIVGRAQSSADARAPVSERRGSSASTGSNASRSRAWTDDSARSTDSAGSSRTSGSRRSSRNRRSSRYSQSTRSDTGTGSNLSYTSTGSIGSTATDESVLTNATHLSQKARDLFRKQKERARQLQLTRQDDINDRRRSSLTSFSSSISFGSRRPSSVSSLGLTRSSIVVRNGTQRGNRRNSIESIASSLSSGTSRSRRSSRTGTARQQLTQQNDRTVTPPLGPEPHVTLFKAGDQARPITLQIEQGKVFLDGKNLSSTAITCITTNPFSRLLSWRKYRTIYLWRDVYTKDLMHAVRFNSANDMRGCFSELKRILNVENCHNMGVDTNVAENIMGKIWDGKPEDYIKYIKTHPKKQRRRLSTMQRLLAEIERAKAADRSSKW